MLRNLFSFSPHPDRVESLMSSLKMSQRRSLFTFIIALFMNMVVEKVVSTFTVLIDFDIETAQKLNMVNLFMLIPESS